MSEDKQAPSINDIYKRAAKRALGGGGAGALAMVAQVGSLMWLRTTMNYQYRYGTSTREALSALYKQGGIRRFYQGIGPALLQGPLSRFGDTAANTGVLTLLDSLDSTKHLPVGVKTVCASAAAATWRMFLMPIDTMKTVMQVEGSHGVSKLRAKIRTGGFGVMYHGSFAAVGATFVGHFPWFFTFNTLNEALPDFDNRWKKLGRRALIGFTSSVVSDTISNSIRVTKVTKQSFETPISYAGAVKHVISHDGVSGLLFRGLKTRLLANGLQGMMFTIVWKGVEDMLNKNQSKSSLL